MNDIRRNSLLDIAARINERYVLLTILALTWVIFFGRNLFGIHYTGWDTHDLGFTFFVYFQPKVLL